MFWLVIILMVAGTYYVVKWGKKKVEQQGREAAEREAQARRPSQPRAQSPAAPLPPPPPATPFDLTKVRVTAQLAGQIGRWSETDATSAFGAPTKSRPPGRMEAIRTITLMWIPPA